MNCHAVSTGREGVPPNPVSDGARRSEPRTSPKPPEMVHSPPPHSASSSPKQASQGALMLEQTSSGSTSSTLFRRPRPPSHLELCSEVVRVTAAELMRASRSPSTLPAAHCAISPFSPVAQSHAHCARRLQLSIINCYLSLAVHLTHSVAERRTTWQSRFTSTSRTPNREQPAQSTSQPYDSPYRRKLPKYITPSLQTVVTSIRSLPAHAHFRPSLSVTFASP